MFLLSVRIRNNLGLAWFGTSCARKSILRNSFTAASAGTCLCYKKSTSLPFLLLYNLNRHRRNRRHGVSTCFPIEFLWLITFQSSTKVGCECAISQWFSSKLPSFHCLMRCSWPYHGFGFASWRAFISWLPNRHQEESYLGRWLEGWVWHHQKTNTIHDRDHT